MNTKNSKVNFIMMIIYGTCTIIWILRVMRDAANNTHQDIFPINVLCTVLWAMSFALSVVQQRRLWNKDKESVLANQQIVHE